jgi:enoyl-CoA hydratase
VSDAYGTIRVERRGHVAEVALDRPEKGNAMSPAFFDEFGRAMHALDADPEVRAILVYAEGKAFSYGLDLMEAWAELGPLLQGSTAGPRMQLLELIRRWQRDTGAPAAIGTPVVVAIHGWCVGGGLDLVSACDIRLCSRQARFSLREARIAIVADIGSLQRLPKIIGDAATRELALTAKDIDAERALRLGLVSEVCDDREALLARARAEADTIAGLSPLVTRGIKQVLELQDGRPVRDGLEQVALWNAAFLQSEDLGEAMAAFLEKREPRYRGA